MTFPSIGRWLCLALCLTLLTGGTALAAEPIDTQAEASLTLTFAPGGVAAQGTEFQVYQVATLDAAGTFTPAAPFDQYDLQLNGLDTDGWAALSRSLADAVAEDELRPGATAQVDQQGRAVFQGLPWGLYLVTGESFLLDGYAHQPQAVLLCLPNGQEDGSWDYDVEANVKYVTKDEDDVIIPDPEIPQGSEQPPGTEKPGGQTKLPQTGMLWWPVPALACGGMLCFLAGWRTSRREDHEG